MIILAADNTFTPLCLLFISLLRVSKISIVLHNNYTGIIKKKWKYNLGYF